ncbi:hypothetical protein, partial [Mycetocola sp.]|uniref:hypothetical protein n=1 Tax=Mycetocola sp. TaxID=1871042 RepID=UPI003988E5FE
ADGILMCRQCHLLIHNNGWKILRDGTTYFAVPPPEIDPEQKPIPLRSKSALARARRRAAAAAEPTIGETSTDATEPGSAPAVTIAHIDVTANGTENTHTADADADPGPPDAATPQDSPRWSPADPTDPG